MGTILLGIQPLLHPEGQQESLLSNTFEQQPRPLSLPLLQQQQQRLSIEGSLTAAVAAASATAAEGEEAGGGGGVARMAAWLRDSADVGEGGGETGSGGGGKVESPRSPSSRRPTGTSAQRRASMPLPTDAISAGVYRAFAAASASAAGRQSCDAPDVSKGSRMPLSIPIGTGGPSGPAGSSSLLSARHPEEASEGAPLLRTTGSSELPPLSPLPPRSSRRPLPATASEQQPPRSPSRPPQAPLGRRTSSSELLAAAQLQQQPRPASPLLSPHGRPALSPGLRPTPVIALAPFSVPSSSRPPPLPHQQQQLTDQAGGPPWRISTRVTTPTAAEDGGGGDGLLLPWSPAASTLPRKGSSSTAAALAMPPPPIQAKATPTVVGLESLKAAAARGIVTVAAGRGGGPAGSQQESKASRMELLLPPAGAPTVPALPPLPAGSKDAPPPPRGPLPGPPFVAVVRSPSPYR